MTLAELLDLRRIRRPIIEQSTRLVARPASTAIPRHAEAANHIVQQLLAGSLPANLAVERPSDEAERAALRSDAAGQFPTNDVQIHANTKAARLAEAFGASALTIGGHLFFGAGHLGPFPSGRRLLGHELIHAEQQRSDGRIRVQLSRLADFVDANPLHDPGRLTDLEIEGTNEYRAYMDPGLVWQTSMHLTADEARLACRLILEAKRAGSPVDWAADARAYAERARRQLSVEREAAGLVPLTMTWSRSGPGPFTDFARWALAVRPRPPVGPPPPPPPPPPAVLAAQAETEARAELPTVASTTVMNCWEMVMLAAFRNHRVTWKWIHDIYTFAGPGWGPHLVDSLTRGTRRIYDRASATRPFPLAGDVVFFNGAAHVALATGHVDGAGRAQVVSFWPPPGTAFTPGGTLDAVKLTTIEELADYMATHPPLTDPTIEFADPPW